MHHQEESQVGLTLNETQLLICVDINREVTQNIVPLWLTAGIAELEIRPLLCNSLLNTFHNNRVTLGNGVFYVVRA
jgi:hypothetical protein